jgi:hypothetical protein
MIPVSVVREWAEEQLAGTPRKDFIKDGPPVNALEGRYQGHRDVLNDLLRMLDTATTTGEASDGRS